MDGVQARVTATQNRSNVPRTGIWKQWKSRERNMQTMLQPSVDKALQATATPLIPGVSPWILCRGRGFNPSTGQRWGSWDQSMISRGQTIPRMCLKQTPTNSKMHFQLQVPRCARALHTARGRIPVLGANPRCWIQTHTLQSHLILVTTCIPVSEDIQNIQTTPC